MGLFDFFKKKSAENDFGMSMVEEERLQKMTQNGTPGDCVMIVEDIFTITGRGIVVTGKIIKGTIRLDESLVIMETGKVIQVKGIEMFRKTLDFATEGDNVGLLLGNVTRNEINSGNRLAKI